MTNSRLTSTKHAQVYDALRREIESGRWRAGDRMPSEAELVQRFGHSRITVGRALRDLQADGIVERRVGSGTFVRGVSAGSALSFGLLIPDLGTTDIFEPICQGMMGSPLARPHALLWGSAAGHATSTADQAWQLCQHYIEREVSGVFFAPLELTPTANDINHRIARALTDARIPIVLLDRTVSAYPAPSLYDVVGIDNRSAGFVAAEHLLSLGCERIAFLAAPNAASTVDAREAGYREALFSRGLVPDASLAARVSPDDTEAVRTLMLEHRPQGIVCANDRTAGRLMHTLRRLAYRVPHDVRLVGIDDVEYAALLPVPLTTLRQPTRQLGELALGVMLQRIAQPDLPPRDTRLRCELVVRESCGANRKAA